MPVPSIDQNICGDWTSQDVDLYAKLPYYFAKGSAQFRKYWQTIPRLLNRVPWTPNMGTTMKRVMVEDSPVLRQMAFPNYIQQAAKVDVTGVRERTTDAKLRWQQFVTPNFNFLPSFQDFLKGNIAPARKNLDRQMMIYEEQFYRTHIFHWSPYVYLSGYGLVQAPSGEGNSSGTGGKTNAWLQNNLPNVTAHLSFAELYSAMNVFEEEIGGTPFEGPGTPGEDSNPLSERFALVTDAMTWNNFVDDPWLKENRPINMNIVTEAFRGDFFGRIRTKLEKYGLRIHTDRDFAPTWPAPETVELNPNATEYNRTLPNYDYSHNAQYRVSYIFGGPSYSIITNGPPPEEFAGGSIPEGFGKMKWNGQIIMNKNFLIPCVDDAGAKHWDTNSWGHYLRLQAECTYGIVGDNKFNVLPIIHFGRNRLTTVTTP